MRQSTPPLQLQTLQTRLFLSVCEMTCQLRPEWVATRPWLAFQAMVKTTTMSVIIYKQPLMEEKKILEAYSLT